MRTCEFVIVQIKLPQQLQFGNALWDWICQLVTLEVTVVHRMQLTKA